MSKTIKECDLDDHEWYRFDDGELKCKKCKVPLLEAENIEKSEI